MRPGPTGRQRRRMAGVALLTTLTMLALQGAALAAPSNTTGSTGHRGSARFDARGLAARLFQRNYLSVAHRGGRGSSAR
jgi:hypothetical protein